MGEGQKPYWIPLKAFTSKQATLLRIDGTKQIPRR